MDKPRVKPLVWEDCAGFVRAVSAANTPFGSYFINRTSDGCEVIFQNEHICHLGENYDPVKTAYQGALEFAQADYEARIIAALEPAPVNSDYLTVLSDKQFEDFARAVERTEQNAPVSLQDHARALLGFMPEITAKPLAEMSDAMKIDAHPAILLRGFCAALRALAGDEGER